MRKLKLNLEELRIDSFEVESDQRGRIGTVRGAVFNRDPVSTWEEHCESYLCPGSANCNSQGFPCTDAIDCFSGTNCVQHTPCGTAC